MSKTEKESTIPNFDRDKFIADSGSVSNAIRILHSQGVSRGDISRKLGKRYQHVRNVLITPIKNPKQ